MGHCTQHQGMGCGNSPDSFIVVLIVSGNSDAFVVALLPGSLFSEVKICAISVAVSSVHAETYNTCGSCYIEWQHFCVSCISVWACSTECMVCIFLEMHVIQYKVLV